MKKLILTIGMCLVLSSFAQAQFLTGCTRDKSKNTYKQPIKRSFAQAKEKEEVTWVKLVRAEERKVNRPSYVGDSMYGLRTPYFSKNAVSKKNSSLFDKRTYNVQRSINMNEVLKGYRFEVPNPVDLTSIYRWEADFLAFLFEQGTRYGTVESAYLPTAKKYQDGVVELRFTPPSSSHTFILQVNCRRKVIYFFLDAYKNQNGVRL